MKKLVLSFIMLLIAAISINAQQTNFFLGQKTPGLTPEIFAPEILTSEKHPHGHISFSNDGKTLFWSTMLKEGPEQTIFYSTFNGQTLSAPRKVSFAADSGCGGPSFSLDGNRIYFNAELPVKSNQKELFAIYYSELSNAGWGKPVVIESTVDTFLTKGQVSVAKSGNIYFSGRLFSERLPSIYICRSVGGQYASPEKIKGDILSVGLLVDPWVDPDEKFLLVSFPPEQGPPMKTDIGISFRNSDGSWGKPIRLNAAVNTSDFERFASLSPDGRYLFFIRSANQQFVGDKAHFYWVSSKIIEELRPK